MEDFEDKRRASKVEKVRGNFFSRVSVLCHRQSFYRCFAAIALPRSISAANKQQSSDRRASMRKRGSVLRPISVSVTYSCQCIAIISSHILELLVCSAEDVLRWPELPLKGCMVSFYTLQMDPQNSKLGLASLAVCLPWKPACG
jgi:hypothetical protein